MSSHVDGTYPEGSNPNPKYGWMCDECKHWVGADDLKVFFKYYDEHKKLNHKSREKMWVRQDDGS